MNGTIKLILAACTAGARNGILAAMLVIVAQVVEADTVVQSTPVIWACDKPFIFGFGSWEKAKEAFPAKEDGIHICSKSCQGGAGIAGLSVPIGNFGDWSPTMTLAVTKQNQAANLTLHLGDSNGASHSYRFDLRKLQPGVPQQLAADYGASLAEPLKVEKKGTKPGLGQVSVLMVIGDWSDKPVDVVLSRIALMPPTDEIRAGRANSSESRRREAEHARLAAEARPMARKTLLDYRCAAPCGRPGGKARVCRGAGRHRHHLAGRATCQQSTRALRCRTGRRSRGRGEGQADSRGEGRQSGGLLPRKRFSGRSTMTAPGLGLLSPDGKWVFIQHETKGQLLDETVVDVPEAYSLDSTDDPNYASPGFRPRSFARASPTASAGRCHFSTRSR